MNPLLCTSAFASLLPALLLAPPASAQDHAGHQGHEQHAPAGDQDAHAGHEMPPTEPADHSGHDMSQPAEPPDHNTMDHSAMDHSQMDHSEMDHGEMDHSEMDHSGMDHAAMDHSTMDHAAMDHSTMDHAAIEHGTMGHAPAEPNPPIASPPPGAFSGPKYAADAAFDPAAMQRARDTLRREHGGMAMGVVMVDRLEARFRNGRDGYSFEADAWFGGDIDRLWLKADGEGAFGGSIDSVELQALWSHAIGPWFNLQAGARQDLRSGPERTHAVVAINGLAPYFFEVEGALFLSTKGELTAHAEAEYDQRLTQRLILQPALGLKLSAQSIPELGLGSGVTSAEAGLRLRYEIEREFAPYVGVQYEHSFGETARLRQAAGDDDRGWSFLLGVRAWF